MVYIYIMYVLDKALLQVLETTLSVLYFLYSTSEGSALSGIENCQLEIHTKQLETHGVVLSLVEQALRLCFTCVALQQLRLHWSFGESSLSSQQLKFFDCGTLISIFL